MAATLTVTRPDLFPAGTTVKAYLLPTPVPGEYNRQGGDPGTWKPALTLLGSPVVAAGGALEVPSAAEGQLLLYASVNSKDVYLQMRSGSGAGSVTSSSPNAVAVGTVSTQLIAANPNRRGLSVENIGPTNSIYLGLGKAAALKEGLGPILVNGTWDGRISGVLWTGAVFAIAETAGVTATVVEI